MKYKELPYIKLNGADANMEETRLRSRKKYSNGLFGKQASISCEVLNRIGRENAMNPHPHSDSNLETHESNNSNRCTYDYHEEKPGNRLTRNSFSCGATREGSSDVPVNDMFAKCSLVNLLKIYEVVHSYTRARDDELDLAEGDTVRLLTEETGEKDWWYGEKEEGVKGLFPSQYVNLIGREARDIPSTDIELISGNVHLGRGSFGIVIKVLYKSKKAALKKPIRSDCFTVLKKEALMINRFEHPHIVELYGISSGDPQGLLLEICEGGSLKNLLHELKSRFVSIRVLVEWAIQISDAMRFVIQAHCIHRDLKTDNILIKESICLCNLLPASQTATPTEDFYSFSHELDRPCFKCEKTPLSRITLKLTDFGLTKAFREEDELKRQSRNAVGTLAFLAPEAFSKHQYSEASDVWSFGVILWSILTKEEPYKDTELSCAFEVATNGESTLEITNECPHQWKEIMLSCWNALPQKRPKFSDLNESFRQYKNKLEADEITSEEEVTVQLAQQAVANFNSKNNNREYCSIQDKMKSRLLELCKIIDQASSVLDKKDKQDELPIQLPRRKKIDKKQIGSPAEVRHVVSVINTNNKAQHPRNAENVLIWPDGTNQWRPNFSGSTPHLNMLGTEAPSLKRSVAIKRRGVSKHGNDTGFASVELAELADIASCSHSDSNSSLISSPSRMISPTNPNSKNKFEKKFVNPSPHGTSCALNVPMRPPRPNVPSIQKHREISLNDTIPPNSHYRNNCSDRYAPPSDGGNISLDTIIPKKHYENFSMSPPTHSAPNFNCGPSTIVPLPKTRPAGQDENPYIECGEVPPGVPRLVNNTYLKTSAGPSHSTTFVNSQYIYFNSDTDKPHRPNHLESKKISTINNSAYVSIADQAPQTIAPPPPTHQAISPPVIPPREGSVGLPPVRQVAS